MSSPSLRKGKKDEAKIYESEIESKQEDDSRKKYSNRNASKRYRAKQKEIVRWVVIVERDSGLRKPHSER